MSDTRVGIPTDNSQVSYDSRRAAFSVVDARLLAEELPLSLLRPAQRSQSLAGLNGMFMERVDRCAIGAACCSVDAQHLFARQARRFLHELLMVLYLTAPSCFELVHEGETRV